MNIVGGCSSSFTYPHRGHSFTFHLVNIPVASCLPQPGRETVSSRGGCAVVVAAVLWRLMLMLQIALVHHSVRVVVLQNVMGTMTSVLIQIVSHGY